MKLYNTLTKQVAHITPLDGEAYRIYSCGPTVYDHIHIGNLSSFIFADTLRRVLASTGTPVKHVMNFTDVDDKTIRRSHEQYTDLEPMTALLKLTSDYSQIFMSDMQAVGNDTSAMSFVKATDSIIDMQKLITALYERGFAYIADDGVYFSIDAYKKSGKLYGQLTEVTSSSTSEARIQNDEYDKESAHDFALWKTAKPGEPSWDFQLNSKDLKGRPGWHIECSAMSASILGQPFDIHTGGVDLIFPHHENEIAQSTATSKNEVYAACFAHNEHLLVDGKKMSKSLNNFHTLKDLSAKGFDPLALRLLVLQAHYRTQAHFSWENLEAAQNSLQNLYSWADLRHQSPQNDNADGQKASISTIEQSLQNNLDTPGALVSLYRLIGIVSPSEQLLHELDDLFGFGLLARSDITDDQKKIIVERQTARGNQDWATSDSLRDQLQEQGIELRDTDNTTIWSRLC